MNRCCLLLASLLSLTGCTGALRGGTIDLHPQPKPIGLRAVAVFLRDERGVPVEGARCGLDGATSQGVASNADGYVLFTAAPASLRDTQLTCEAVGYAPFSEHRQLQTADNETLDPAVLRRLHVDPFAAPLDDVLNFRSGLFSTYAGDCDLPFGIRPHQRTNIIFFGAYFYSAEQLACTNAVWRGLGYTHGIMGPFIAQGYHGQTPDQDVTESPEAAADAIARVQHQIDQGFKVVLALVPDHCGVEGIPGVCGPWEDHIWTVAELRGSKLEAFYKSAAFQALADETMLCWECQGSKYGWPNRRYVEYFAWVSEVFPRARVKALHVISDIEAPVGAGDETNVSACGAKTRLVDCLTNGEAWTNVAHAGMNVFFHQSNAVITADHVADNGKTDGANWLELWTLVNPASFIRRFSDPTVSKDWPKTVVPCPAEYLSIEVYNDRRTMDEAREWGHRAVAAGARCALDGWRP